HRGTARFAPQPAGRDTAFEPPHVGGRPHPRHPRLSHPEGHERPGRDLAPTPRSPPPPHPSRAPPASLAYYSTEFMLPDDGTPRLDHAERTPIGLSIVTPVRNEESALPDMLDCQLAALRTLGLPFEILVVDDASSDRTGEVARAIAGRHPEVSLI